MYISLLLVALLSVLLIGAGGESSSIAAGQVYWNNVLPKTSMPKAIKDLLIQPVAATKVLPTSNNIWNKASTVKVLPTDNRNYKASTVKVLSTDNRNYRASSVKVLPTDNRNYKASTVKVLPTDNRNYKASTVKVLPTDNRNYKASTVKVLPTDNRNYKASTVKVLPTDNRNYKASTVLPTDNRNYKASTVKVLPTSNNKWNKASTTKLITDSSIKNQKIAGDEKWSYDPTMTIYLFKEDLQAGTKMTLSFPDPSTYGTTFISKRQANSIPFASSNLPNVLSLFSIDPNSPVASAMKENLAACEEKPMEGEIKHCATSLESMVDFAISALKTRNLLSVSTTTDKENRPKQEYEVTSSNIKSSGDNTVVCHAQTYVYAVFYCHKLRGVDVFDVEMVGADGSKVKAVAICHRDTSKWNPKNLALRILNVKPGTVPVCHFLPQYDVLWMSKK